MRAPMARRARSHARPAGDPEFRSRTRVRRPKRRRITSTMARGSFGGFIPQEATMTERELRKLIGAVKDGKVTRRQFVQRMVGLGLTVPMAGHLLLNAGVAQSQTAFAYKGTKRGGGGVLKTLWWQGATLLNPHFAVGTKDQDGSRIF